MREGQTDMNIEIVDLSPFLFVKKDSSVMRHQKRQVGILFEFMTKTWQ